MKTKQNIFLMLMLCLFASISSISKAQQQPSIAKPNNLTKVAANNIVPVYTYKIFQAPNKLYGYDIFKNGKGIFHQTVSTKTADESAIATKEIGERAAMLSIQKLKNNINPNLSPQEIKKITAQ